MATPVNDQDDDKWLETLAGRQQASQNSKANELLHQASQLRAYFEKRDLQEQQQAVDPAWEAKLMQRVRAKHRGVGNTRAAIKPDTPPLWKQLVDWLVPPSQGLSGRYAAFATLAMAVVLLPAVLQHGQQGDVPADVAKGGIKLSQPQYWILVADPQSQAQQFCAGLMSQSIACTLRPANKTFEVTAQMTTAQLETLRAKLSSWGVPLPLDGRLVLRFGANE